MSLSILIFILLIISDKKELSDNYVNIDRIQEKSKIENAITLKPDRLKQDIVYKEVANKDIEVLKEFSKQMKELYTSVNFDKEFSDKFEVIYVNNKKIVNEVMKILVDNDYAINNFNEDQAYSRIFSIKFLEEIAKKYDKEPLIKTVKQIAENINNEKVSYSGVSEDLDELLSAYIRIHEIDEFVNNLENHLNELDYFNKKNSDRVQEVYDDAIFFSLRTKYNRNEITEIMKPFSKK